MVGVLHFRSAGSIGWQERYYLKTTDFTAALGALDELSWRRRYWQSSDTEQIWARVSFVGRPRDARGLEGLPRGETAQQRDLHKLLSADDAKPWTVNDPFAAAHYRFETAGGKVGNRLFRGLPDNLINEFRIDPSAVEVPAIGTALANYQNTNTGIPRGRGEFLAWVRDNTYSALLVTPGTPPTYSVEAWARVLFRRVGKRDSGRPFGLFRGRRS